MDKRQKRIEVFEDTKKQISENPILSKLCKDAMNSQLLYMDGEKIDIPPESGQKCTTVVSTRRSFEAAALYKGKKTCVLNFASATNPGGGVANGSTAQEECLCRCSTLYQCLSMQEIHTVFYRVHRRMADPMYCDDCIYTPNVTVFKKDIALPEMLPEDEWYTVDVITCAAPNLKATQEEVSEDKLYDIFVKRIDMIFRVAIENKAEVLILGAFGCGAFGNSPKLVSKAFKAVQKKYERYFKTIEYAVYSNKKSSQNFEEFKKTFAGEEPDYLM